MDALKIKLDQIDSAYQLMPKLTKIVGIVSSLCGFIYLLAYTREIGIPFPLELSVLPMLLLIVGVAAVAGVSLLVGGILIPAIIADDPLDVTKTYFLAQDTTNNIPQTRASRYFLCTWVPMMSALFALLFQLEIFGKGVWANFASLALLIFSALWIFATPKYVSAFQEKRWQYVITILIQTIFSAWAYCLAILVGILAFPNLESLPAWQGALPILVIFSLVHFLVTVPHSKGKPGRILLPPAFKHEAASSATAVFLMAGFAVVLTVFNYPLNARVGGTVLRAFGVGGGVPAILCLKNKPTPAVTQRMNFVEECSEPLQILFDGGDRLYVGKTQKNNAGASEKSKNYSEPIYFRQDEVRQKIYLEKRTKD